ncbi:amidohydrolase family protein [Marimonas lutisalis]|uniref:amidohydrolase family protein n=1 Tax=Marimonas lutisalis TaxID=2545756 RepID=UPI0013756158|nr:amidohydrolase family protein [Marimonas lutisalis]
MRWKLVAGLGGVVVLAGAAAIYTWFPAWSGKSMPIIDAHMHTYQWNKYGDPPEPNLITRNVPAARSDDEAIDAYLAEMERHNIVLAIGSGELETVEKWRQRAPDKFIGGIEFPRYTTPVYQRRQGWPDLDGLRQKFEDGTLGILGEVTAQYAGLSPDDPQFDAYFALAAEMDVPVSFHSGFGPPMSAQRGDPGFRMRLGNPLLLEDVLVKYPRLRVYIAHGGYPYIDDTIALMMQYQQVYVDLSAIDWLLTEDEFNAYLKRLVQARLEDRIMFGTDQMIWPETVRLSIAAIERAKFLTAKQKRKIFFENAVNFFDLEREVLLGGESVVGPNGKIVRVIRGTIELRPREPGAYEEVEVDLDLSGVTSAAVRVKGFDVDATEEAVMTINGTEVPLPPEIVSDMQERSVTIELPEGVLTNGKNTIGFLFAEAVGGTTGYAVHDLRILLRK